MLGSEKLFDIILSRGIVLGIFIDLFRDHKKPRLAPFCKECLKKANWAVGIHKARRKPEYRYSFYFSNTEALVGLLGIYKSMLPPKAKTARRLSGGR